MSLRIFAHINPGPLYFDTIGFNCTILLRPSHFDYKKVTNVPPKSSGDHQASTDQVHHKKGTKVTQNSKN